MLRAGVPLEAELGVLLADLQRTDPGLGRQHLAEALRGRGQVQLEAPQRCLPAEVALVEHAPVAQYQHPVGVLL